MALVGIVVGILISALLSGIVIWIVGMFGLGLEVSGLGAAFMAGVVIAVISGLITWFWSLLGYAPGSGIAGAIIHWITAAVVLMFAGNLIKGLKVNGYSGALIGAAAIAVVGWLIGLGLNAIGLS